ncbi:MAG: hypothetical protein MPJ50_02380 [Pirellulales bacterium]|nr:hypothetical protein [Pirellulales bacterium]
MKRAALHRFAVVFTIGVSFAIAMCCAKRTVCAQQPDEEERDSSATSADNFPRFEQIKSLVKRSFASLPDFKEGELITKSQVQIVCEDVRTFGWKVFPQKEILANVLADTAFLAKELRTKRGRKFMSKISALPGAYDKLDRLSRLPHGRKTVHDLINGVGGDELIVYLTTASGGQELGKLLANAPKGRDFNEPTGTIYTAEQFLIRLEAEHSRELERLKAKQAGQK